MKNPSEEELFKFFFREWVKREFNLNQLKNYAKRELPNEVEKLLKAENSTFTSADIEDTTSKFKEQIEKALNEVKEGI